MDNKAADNFESDNISEAGSRITRSSSWSTVSAVTRARAKTEAARVRPSFAAKEMQLKMESANRDAKMLLEKAELDAALQVFNLHREVAAATARVEALWAAVVLGPRTPSPCHPGGSHITWGNSYESTPCTHTDK